jgi:hypothetical protein
VNVHPAFIKDLIATDPLPAPSSVLYERIVAGNGLFLRGHRQQLDVLFPIAEHTIPGLPSLHPSIQPSPPPIPADLITQVLVEAYTAWTWPGGPFESLFHFTYTDTWQLDIPDQVQTATSVRPKDVDHCPSYQTCLVEIHSHHQMEAYFSSIDNEDETGFRIYGVCGNFRGRPRFTFRVGLYGHFHLIPAALIAALPEGVDDTYLLKRTP